MRTKNANRRRFNEFLGVECRRLSRTGQDTLSCILLDIDHFKKYNDTYGHVAGDDCICRVAQVIRSVVRRKTDLAARYGGEEFGCILPATTLAAAVDLAERIRTEVEGLRIPHSASTSAAHVTVSLGVASVAATDDEAARHALVSTADAALYQAKTSGRNRVHPLAC